MSFDWFPFFDWLRLCLLELVIELARKKGGEITYYVYIVSEPVIAVQNKTIQRTDSESSEDYYEGFSYF